MKSIKQNTDDTTCLDHRDDSSQYKNKLHFDNSVFIYFFMWEKKTYTIVSLSKINENTIALHIKGAALFIAYTAMLSFIYYFKCRPIIIKLIKPKITY